MKSFRDYLGLLNSCSYDVDDVIGRADRFGFQNFCSPALHCLPFWIFCSHYCILRAFPDERIWESLKAKHYIFFIGGGEGGAVGVGCFSTQWVVGFCENVIL